MSNAGADWRGGDGQGYTPSFGNQPPVGRGVDALLEIAAQSDTDSDLEQEATQPSIAQQYPSVGNAQASGTMYRGRSASDSIEPREAARAARPSPAPATEAASDSAAALHRPVAGLPSTTYGPSQTEDRNKPYPAGHHDRGASNPPLAGGDDLQPHGASPYARAPQEGSRVLGLPLAPSAEDGHSSPFPRRDSLHSDAGSHLTDGEERRRARRRASEMGDHDGGGDEAERGAEGRAGAGVVAVPGGQVGRKTGGYVGSAYPGIDTVQYPGTGMDAGGDAGDVGPGRRTGTPGGRTGGGGSSTRGGSRGVPSAMARASVEAGHVGSGSARSSMHGSFASHDPADFRRKGRDEGPIGRSLFGLGAQDLNHPRTGDGDYEGGKTASVRWTGRTRPVYSGPHGSDTRFVPGSGRSRRELAERIEKERGKELTFRPKINSSYKFKRRRDGVVESIERRVAEREAEREILAMAVQQQRDRELTFKPRTQRSPDQKQKELMQKAVERRRQGSDVFGYLYKRGQEDKRRAAEDARAKMEKEAAMRRAEEEAKQRRNLPRARQNEGASPSVKRALAQREKAKLAAGGRASDLLYMSAVAHQNPTAALQRAKRRDTGEHSSAPGDEAEREREQSAGAAADGELEEAGAGAGAGAGPTTATKGGSERAAAAATAAAHHPIFSEEDVKAAQDALGAYAPRKAVLAALQAQRQETKPEQLRTSGSPQARRPRLRKGQGIGGGRAAGKVEQIHAAREHRIQEDLRSRVDRDKAARWRERVEATKAALSRTYKAKEEKEGEGGGADAAYGGDGAGGGVAGPAEGYGNGKRHARGRIQTPPDLESDYTRMQALGVMHSLRSPGLGRDGKGYAKDGEGAGENYERGSVGDVSEPEEGAVPGDGQAEGREAGKTVSPQRPVLKNGGAPTSYAAKLVAESAKREAQRKREEAAAVLSPEQRKRLKGQLNESLGKYSETGRRRRAAAEREAGQAELGVESKSEEPAGGLAAPKVEVPQGALHDRMSGIGTRPTMHMENTSGRNARAWDGFSPSSLQRAEVAAQRACHVAMQRAIKEGKSKEEAEQEGENAAAEVLRAAGVGRQFQAKAGPQERRRKRTASKGSASASESAAGEGEKGQEGEGEGEDEPKEKLSLSSFRQRVDMWIQSHWSKRRALEQQRLGKEEKDMQECTHTPIVREVPAYLLANGRRPQSKLPQGARIPGVAARRRRELRAQVLQAKRQQQAAALAQQRAREQGVPVEQVLAEAPPLQNEMEETVEEVLSMAWGPVARDPEPRGYKESVQRLRGAAAYRAAVSRVERGKELRPFGLDEEEEIEDEWEQEQAQGPGDDAGGQASGQRGPRRTVGVEVARAARQAVGMGSPGDRRIAKVPAPGQLVHGTQSPGQARKQQSRTPSKGPSSSSSSSSPKKARWVSWGPAETALGSGHAERPLSDFRPASEQRRSEKWRMQATLRAAEEGQRIHAKIEARRQLLQQGIQPHDSAFPTSLQNEHDRTVLRAGHPELVGEMASPSGLGLPAPPEELGIEPQYAGRPAGDAAAAGASPGASALTRSRVRKGRGLRAGTGTDGSPVPEKKYQQTDSKGYLSPSIQPSTPERPSVQDPSPFDEGYDTRGNEDVPGANTRGLVVPVRRLGMRAAGGDTNASTAPSSDLANGEAAEDPQSSGGGGFDDWLKTGKMRASTAAARLAAGALDRAAQAPDAPASARSPAGAGSDILSTPPFKQRGAPGSTPPSGRSPAQRAAALAESGGDSNKKGNSPAWDWADQTRAAYSPAGGDEALPERAEQQQHIDSASLPGGRKALRATTDRKRARFGGLSSPPAGSLPGSRGRRAGREQIYAHGGVTDKDALVPDESAPPLPTEEQERRNAKAQGYRGRRTSARKRRRSIGSVQSSVAVATRGTGSYQAALLQRESTRLREQARLAMLDEMARREAEEDEVERERVVQAAQMVARGLVGPNGEAVGGWGPGEAPLQPEFHHGQEATQVHEVSDAEGRGREYDVDVEEVGAHGRGMQGGHQLDSVSEPGSDPAEGTAALAPRGPAREDSDSAAREAKPRPGPPARRRSVPRVPSGPRIPFYSDEDEQEQELDNSRGAAQPQEVEGAVAGSTGGSSRTSSSPGDQSSAREFGSSSQYAGQDGLYYPPSLPTALLGGGGSEDQDTGEDEGDA